MQITRFDEMVAAAVQVGPVPMAVAAAHDPEVLRAVDRAQREGIVRATLVGDWPAIEAYAAQTGTDLAGMAVIHEADTRLAANPDHLAGLLDGQRQGFFTQDIFSGSCGLDHHLEVQMRRGADVDHIHIR